MKRIVWIALAAVTLIGSGVRADDPAEAKVLDPGKYSASVVAIPCDACPPVIEKTLKAQPGIDAVSVDQKASSVQFTVKPGARVPLPDLQKALKAASDEMGMGADYRLKNVKTADSPSR